MKNQEKSDFFSELIKIIKIMKNQIKLMKFNEVNVKL